LDKTRSISEQILRRYPKAFSADFEGNKKALGELAIISSKQLRNHIAGYLAKALKEEAEPEQVAQEIKA
jgi:small subunit ribosomal protein S17e